MLRKLDPHNFGDLDELISHNFGDLNELIFHNFGDPDDHNFGDLNELIFHNFDNPDGTFMQLRRREKERKPMMYRLFFFYNFTFVVLMSFFVKITHVGNRSKLDNLLKTKKVTHNFCDNHKIDLLFQTKN